MKGKRGREDPCGTCGHYHDVGLAFGNPPSSAPPQQQVSATTCLLLQYENGEPCTICGHVLVTHTLQHESVMPTTLVPGFLYLGNYDTASRQEILKAFNITHVLNVSSSADTAAGHVAAATHACCTGIPGSIISLPCASAAVRWCCGC
jgi:dual specificity MAP kinase phosphatase